jgi:hypothetical protein
MLFNRNLEISPNGNSHLIFDEGAKSLCQRTSTNHVGKSRSSCRTPTRPISLILYKKWIKDHNIRSETLKWLEENIWKTLEDNTGHVFLNRIPMTQKIKTRK